MKRKRHTEEQIIAILKEHEAGVKTADLCRKHGISEASFYNWKAKYGGLEVSEAKRLKGLESENARLKKLLADVQLAHELVGVRDDHCARPDCLARLSVSPLVPQARDGDRRAVASRKVVRLLTAGRVMPCVIARRGDQATRVLEGFMEHRVVCDRLDARVEGRETPLLERLGSPGGYEAPAHRDERS